MKTKLYNKAKLAKVGETVVCPSCGTLFVKSNYQQAFCKSKPKTMCKDKYWNTVDPKKRNNTTRISPASKRWLTNKTEILRRTSEGYKVIDGVAYDEYDTPVYNVDEFDDTHPFDLG